MPRKRGAKPETSLGQWLLYGVFAVAAISSYLLISSSLRSRDRLDAVLREYRELEADVTQLDAQNNALMEHIRDFRENPEFEAERRMRTEFKWAQEGEWIYLVERESTVRIDGSPLKRQILEFEAGSD